MDAYDDFGNNGYGEEWGQEENDGWGA